MTSAGESSDVTDSVLSAAGSYSATYAQRMREFSSAYRQQVSDNIDSAVERWYKYLERVYGNGWLIYPRTLFERQRQTRGRDEDHGDTDARMNNTVVREWSDEQSHGTEIDFEMFVDLKHDLESAYRWKSKLLRRFVYGNLICATVMRQQI